MARIKGLFSVSANYEPTIAAPLDAREVVQYKSDLLSRKTWLKNGSLYLYDGMRVSVTEDTNENNGVYVLTNKDLYMEASSWKQLATMDEIKELQKEIEQISVGSAFDIVDDLSMLPQPGTSGKIWYVRAEGASYSWDTDAAKYIIVGSNFNDIKIISGGNSVRK